jgi:hypothetical protein
MDSMGRHKPPVKKADNISDAHLESKTSYHQFIEFVRVHRFNLLFDSTIVFSIIGIMAGMRSFSNHSSFQACGRNLIAGPGKYFPGFYHTPIH